MQWAILWTKMLHISALVVWVAALFCLPALFAAHPTARAGVPFRRLRVMTRFTYIAVASPAAVLAVASGTALIWLREAMDGWLMAKLTAVALLVAFHVYCGRLLGLLWEAPRRRPPAAHFALVAAPAALVPAILYLVLAQPF